MAVTPDEPAEAVRRGYNAVSYRYRGDNDNPTDYLAWLSTLQQRLPAAADVLDLGCGCGIPVAKTLAEGGHRVIGVDISDVQIERARRLVPVGTFVRADATEITFLERSFDAVVSLYALIHIPTRAQPQLISRISAWLRPGGWLLATAGAEAWTGTEDNWLDSGATMWWSHADATTYRDWLTQAGLHIEAEDFVPEGGSGHQLFWARRPC
jgi:2-polyprenyl-3-methyl-5-hydroxy-6-metoxy-1,4-benzoquinol methylase